jgi:hypothetical protein
MMIAGPAAHQIKYYVLAMSEWVFTRAGSKADDRAPRRNPATVQHVDHAPNSPGSSNSFTLSGIGSPSTIRARSRLVKVLAPVFCIQFFA